MCNDLNTLPKNYKLKWQLEKNGKVISAAETHPVFPENSSEFQGFVKFKAPDVAKRTKYKLRLALFDEKGQGVSESDIDLDVFPDQNKKMSKPVYTFSEEGIAGQLLKELSVEESKRIESAGTVLIDDYSYYQKNKEKLDRMVEKGKTLVFFELPEGNFEIGKSKVDIEHTVMGQYYFVSPKSGHSMVKDARPFDFHFWYNDSKGLVTPFLRSMIKAGPEWSPILKTGKTTWVNMAGEYSAVVEMKKGKGKYRICQLQLNKRVKSNPVAKGFSFKIIEL